MRCARKVYRWLIWNSSLKCRVNLQNFKRELDHRHRKIYTYIVYLRREKQLAQLPPRELPTRSLIDARFREPVTSSPRRGRRWRRGRERCFIAARREQSSVEQSRLSDLARLESRLLICPSAHRPGRARTIYNSFRRTTTGPAGHLWFLSPPCPPPSSSPPCALFRAFFFYSAANLIHVKPRRRPPTTH